MNTRTLLLTTLATLALLATPSTAQRLSRQDEKNLMRNVGIGLGVAATHQLLRGRGGDALLLGAGAALAGKKYEDARKAQNEECEGWRRPRPALWRRDDRNDRDDRRRERGRHERTERRWRQEARDRRDCD